MSSWTHIVAVLDVETNIHEQQKEKFEEVLREKLKGAPKITGSEQDAHVIVNQLPGYNEIMFDDDNNPIKYQTRAVITVVGDLRDRMRKQTTDEWIKFMNYIGIESDSIGDGELSWREGLNYIIRTCVCDIKGW